MLSVYPELLMRAGFNVEFCWFWKMPVLFRGSIQHTSEVFLEVLKKILLKMV